MSSQPGCDCSICESDHQQQSNRIHDGLRDPIASLLYQRDGFIVPWEEAAEFLVRDYRKTADLVIAELDMVQETNYGTTYPRWPVTNRRLTRWVTKWKVADD
jgi:hypothetical protein